MADRLKSACSSTASALNIAEITVSL